jgi:hypothetical protein
MTPTQDPLRALAARWQAVNPDTTPRTRAELEANLLPLVRRALRGGPALPDLVGWVRRALSNGELTAPGIEREAPRLTRLLCAQLLGLFRTVPTAADTVVGR